MLKRREAGSECHRARATTGELLVTWLTPLLREHETIEQLRLPAPSGSTATTRRDPGRLKARADLGERVCALWPFEAFAVEIASTTSQTTSTSSGIRPRTTSGCSRSTTAAS